MKYLCLVYGEEKAIQSMNDRHCLDYDESIRASGHCIASEALQPIATATTVRVRNGKVSVTDGPFAETKECLAGSTSSRRATSTKRSSSPPASRPPQSAASRYDPFGRFVEIIDAWLKRS